MTKRSSISCSILAHGVALLTFDLAGNRANVLCRRALAELAAHLDHLESDVRPIGLILASARPTVFLHGPDLRQWMPPRGQSVEQIAAEFLAAQAVLRRLSSCPFVTIAAVEGSCSGAGAELAAWCDRRVVPAEPGTTFVFPHTTWGMIPAWGATARVPRLVGLEAAIPLIAGSVAIGGKQAVELGLVNARARRSQDLVAKAMEMIRAEQISACYLDDRQRTARPLSDEPRSDDLLDIDLNRLLAEVDHPAPEIAGSALSLMQATRSLDIEAACLEEAVRAATLLCAADVSPLVHVGRLVQECLLRHVDLKSHCSLPPIRSVGICGAGAMGEGVAACNVMHRTPVRIYDPAPEALERTMARIRLGVHGGCRDVWRRIMWSADAESLLNIHCTESELGISDLVIESVVENRELKQQVLQSIESAMKPDAILASNTSTVSVTELARVLKHAERFCGLHFCNPAEKRRLVEVVRGHQTTDETVERVVAYAKRIGKLPIVVRDCPGFLINRLLLYYLNEALEMLCEGVPLETIDRAARQFGMPLGPFELLDMIGCETAMMAGRTMWEAFPDRVTLTPVLPALVKRNRMGWKTKLGFYHYDRVPGPAQVDPQFSAIIQPYVRPGKSTPGQDVMLRLLLPMLLEATRVLDEQIVQHARDIDTGVVFGLAFPAWRGGLLYWADQLGAARILDLLEPLESLGLRMQPTDRLRDMAAKGRKFHV